MFFIYWCEQRWRFHQVRRLSNVQKFACRILQSCNISHQIIYGVWNRDVYALRSYFEEWLVFHIFAKYFYSNFVTKFWMESIWPNHVLWFVYLRGLNCDSCFFCKNYLEIPFISLRDARDPCTKFWSSNFEGADQLWGYIEQDLHRV